MPQTARSANRYATEKTHGLLLRWEKTTNAGDTIELRSQPVHVEEALRRVESVLRSA
ncbi:MAG: hypothetical protein AAGA92_07370 [Planctomycetota bacterium]